MHICIGDYQFALVILVMFIVSIHLSHDLINHYVLATQFSINCPDICPDPVSNYSQFSDLVSRCRSSASVLYPCWRSQLPIKIRIMSVIETTMIELPWFTCSNGSSTTLPKNAKLFSVRRATVVYKYVQ